MTPDFGEDRAQFPEQRTAAPVTHVATAHIPEGIYPEDVFQSIFDVNCMGVECVTFTPDRKIVITGPAACVDALMFHLALMIAPQAWASGMSLAFAAGELAGALR